MRKGKVMLRQFLKCSIKKLACVAMLVWVIGPSSAWAEWKSSRCSEFVGTYLITNFEENGDIDSRSLITFWGDGNFMFIDSNQGGVPTKFNPFTDAAGSWTCSNKGGKKRVATVIALDFTLPGSEGTDQEIARLDFFNVKVDRKTGNIKGSAKLRFFPLDTNPLGHLGPIQDPFFFEGMRVEARPMRKSRTWLD